VRRTWTWWLAWGLFAAAIGFHLAAAILVALGIGVGSPADEELTAGSLGFLVAFYVYPLVGLVIAQRRPENAIGWVFLGTGLTLALSNLAASYADYALFVDPGSLPTGVWAAWAVSWLDPLFFVGLLLLLLLFPTGRPASPRWRPAFWALGLGAGLTILTSAVRPGAIFKDSLPVQNPVGVESIGGLLGAIEVLSTLLFLGAGVAAVIGLVLRFRRARGVERLQFRWFAAAGCLLLASFLTLFLGLLGLPAAVSESLIGLGVTAVALAVGAAILRYRLYEIDRIISRTLVYASLTMILGAAYVGLVLVGQALFSSFAGGSDLAIAASTLIVAALFLPVRSGVQRFVDRRFYRRRYDAQRTLEAFGGRLREQVDLETLQGELRSVVQTTMQPTHASVWLRPGAKG
jgi:hypothetical protein